MLTSAFKETKISMLVLDSTIFLHFLKNNIFTFKKLISSIFTIFQHNISICILLTNNLRTFLSLYLSCRLVIFSFYIYDNNNDFIVDSSNLKDNNNI